MRFLWLLIVPIIALAQSNIPQDQVKIGRPQTADDKELVFDTNDGVSNKKLSVEKTSKKLKWNGNSVQIGDGAAVDKELSINGSSGKYLKWDASSGQFEFNDDLGLDSSVLKTNSIDAFSGTETAIEQNTRVKGSLKIGTGNNEIRVSAGNLEFSNDGALYKKIGSGSGSGDGGISILENGSFEDGLTPGWQNTGGTFTQQTYTNSVEGETKYARFIASGAGQYFETTLKVIPDFGVGGCLAKINYNTADAANWKLQVYDSLSNLLKEENLYARNWQDGFASFPCPVVGTEVQARVISIAAGQIEADKGYLGKENRTFQVSSQKIHYITFSGSSTQTTNGLLNGHSVGTIYGDALLPPTVSTNPSLRFKAGTYGPMTCYFSGRCRAGNGSGSTCTIEYTGTSPLMYNTFGTAGSSGTTNADFSKTVFAGGTYPEREFQASFSNVSPAASPSHNISVITCVENPLESQTALRPEAQDWFIDANIGGANIDLAAGTSLLSFSEIATNASLDMVLRPGSAQARIPCQGTNPATGLTCAAGNESLGVNFIAPTPGYYDVCFFYAHGTSSSSTNNVFVTFQPIETGVANQTIIQESGSRIASQGYNGGYNIENTNSIPNHCGSFFFSSAGEKTVRLMREQNFTGTPHASFVIADRAADKGQRDIRVTVRPSLTPYNRPYLVGEQVVARGATSAEIASVSYGTTNASTVCNASPCTYVDQIGSAVSQVTRTSTGIYNLVLARTYTKVKCTLSATGAASVNGYSINNISCNNCSSVQFSTSNQAGTSIDTHGTVNCMLQP